MGDYNKDDDYEIWVTEIKGDGKDKIEIRYVQYKNFEPKLRIKRYFFYIKTQQREYSKSNSLTPGELDRVNHAVQNKLAGYIDDTGSEPESSHPNSPATSLPETKPEPKQEKKKMSLDSIPEATSSDPTVPDKCPEDLFAVKDE